MHNFDWNRISQYKENIAEFDDSARQWFGSQMPKGQRASHSKMPKASEIVKFWYRWGRLHLKLYESDAHKVMPAFVEDLVIDLGEPFCFACRVRIPDWEFARAEKTKKFRGLIALYKHWDSLPLERAHIIPLSRGGSNRLRNFVLLCHPCHKDAPDVVDSSIMLTWLQNRKQLLVNRDMRDWVDACLQIGADPIVVVQQRREIIARFAEEFENFQYDFSTNHFDTYSVSSLVASIVTFAKQKAITGERES